MYRQVLDFWFDEVGEAQWWVKDAALDQQIGSGFADLHRQAARCELYRWRQQPEGRLAEIIVLDQFSRNMFRDSRQAFAQDALALALAQEMIAMGAHRALSTVQRSFVYLPFMHSESLLIHDVAVALFSEKGLERNYDFEVKHKAILKRFGRYPHRNALLGRPSTEAELAFLTEPGSSF